ncbi:MAG: methyltransferase domain-containing protein, partial [Candidatus Heimdallarchaeota archaeon]|nr:methyltransferase domain-containing protein [Candidatus Heimdallarchaeota archaeon]
MKYANLQFIYQRTNLCYSRKYAVLFVNSLLADSFFFFIFLNHIIFINKQTLSHIIKKNQVNKMVELISNSLFRILSTMISIRDILINLEKVVEEIGIQPGNVVLDYGCGLGSFSIPAAKIVGEKGKVYALDIHPLAIKRTKKKA